MTHLFEKLKEDPKPDAVFVGRNHKHINYGQTGYALWNFKWELEFFPDGEVVNVGYIVSKDDVWYVLRESDEEKSNYF